MTLMETVQFLGAIGEFVGAIAVVVTLIYLAAQVRHSRTATQAATLEAGRTRRIEFFETVRDSRYLPEIQVKVSRGEELDEVERLRLTNHYGALWGLLYAEWIQRDLGIVGEYATHPEIGLLQALGSPVGMQWWRNAGIKLYPQRFVDYIEKMIRELDIDALNTSIARAGFVVERGDEATTGGRAHDHEP
jgi:hypothetical protein